MMFDNIEQQTPEWYEVKIGKVGASRLADVMAEGKNGKPSATRANYMYELLTARLTGEYQQTYQSPEMLRGIELEAEARRKYEIVTFNEVKQVGWIPHPEIEMCGCSPDGLVDDDGLIEIKCPNTKTHLETVLHGKIDRSYMLQMQWQIECSGREWCDFVSYDPRLPENIQICIIRVDKKQEVIDSIKTAVQAFLSELAELENKIRSLNT